MGYASKFKRIMMNKITKCSALLTAILLVGCNGLKKEHNDNHAHGRDTHTHDNETLVLTDYFGAYDLKDEIFGTVTKMIITADSRVLTTNSLPNHSTGEFPNPGNPNVISAQNRTFNFPLNPKYTGKAQWVREPGVAVNGIKFEPGTAEVVVCETGENFRVEALQDVIDLGLDENHAHVQPTGAYHYHGTPTAVIDDLDSANDLVHIGFAHDGFPMYYSKNGTYKPSYKAVGGDREGEDCSYENPMQSMDISVGGHHDGTYTSDFEYVAGSGDLDECNGITIDGKYMYLVTNEFPYVSRCLMGEFESQERGGPPQGGGQGGRPNAKQVFKEMDSNTDGKISKVEAKGPLQQKFSEVDTNGDNYISVEELEKGMSQRKRPRGRK